MVRTKHTSLLLIAVAGILGKGLPLLAKVTLILHIVEAAAQMETEPNLKDNYHPTKPKLLEVIKKETVERAYIFVEYILKTFAATTNNLIMARYFFEDFDLEGWLKMYYSGQALQEETVLEGPALRVDVLTPQQWVSYSAFFVAKYIILQELCMTWNTFVPLPLAESHQLHCRTSQGVHSTAPVEVGSKQEAKDGDNSFRNHYHAKHASEVGSFCGIPCARLPLLQEVPAKNNGAKEQLSDLSTHPPSHLTKRMVQPSGVQVTQPQQPLSKD
jgi:hypothetical protein